MRLGAPSCERLPPWPTPRQLLDAGFVIRVPDAQVVVGIIAAILGGGIFLPQCCKFLRRSSVQGASVAWVSLAMMATSWQLAGIIVDVSPTLYACKAVSPGECFANVLSLIQLLLQAAGATGVFLCYLWVWQRRECLALGGCRVAEVRRTAAGAAAAFVVAMAAPLTLVSLALTLGPCADVVQAARTPLAAVATAMQSCHMLPQIALLCSTRDHGSLSVFTVAALVLGSTAYMVVLAFERASLVNLLPFCVVVAQGSVLLGSIVYFKRQVGSPQR
mmetsp:Transcript_44264/g.99805  ORF Transcript_44264/g.99805 Transcript_44264/m.99805 type:complete len:275 (+) Transcript_44264:90-914(+)